MAKTGKTKNTVEPTLGGSSALERGFRQGAKAHPQREILDRAYLV